ncbi:pyruvate dehydrogenase [Dactylosporangium sp. NBC_01737]|uniref:transketolase-like TK C-terminal-containing protein n=1 Tax=Dactylosporangium sp. NBC_01737 TaxID=2975959 RepID=UPI002E0DDDF6|nr:pyruvate dehydrogenase [Dactylosporangium sp. NBC_01737]
MVDSANHDRDTADGVKVGGHQASSASMVSVLTALYFAHLDAADRVSVKPHASPVFHAIEYLLGRLDRSYLTRLRALGGLQSYPSRTKDPDQVDFSTGSVGLGAAAPLFAAAVRRYVDAHFGARPHSRFIALLGDAELDEGNVWEAVADTATAGLGNVTWIVDLNRQSLDRIVPGVRIGQWGGLFEAAGWHTVEVKYGRRLQSAFARPGGDALRSWLDAMPNERYQALFGMSASVARAQFCEGAPDEVVELLRAVPDADLLPLLTDLAGHDPASILEALRAADAVTDRPTVVFLYTVKGWGLPIAGNPRNHSALLTTEQVDTLRAANGLTAATEWDRLDPATPAGALVERRRAELTRPARRPAAQVTVPTSTGLRSSRPLSTQEAFGRVLVNLSRIPEVAPLLVTTAPDVATSTNLAGFVNRAGVFSPQPRQSWNDDAVLRWTESPAGQHIELGIAEMNVFLLLGQLGLAWDLSDQPLLPIGTVYDPFVCRGLDAFIYATYSGSRFIVAGTPSGITLAPEGGAHQSTITPSIGLELPGVELLEPAYVTALDWQLCDALGRIAREEPGAYYLRLSTRPLDQGPFEAARARLGDAVLRQQVIAGAYRLVDASELAATGAPVVTLAATGAVLPETLAAAAELADEGIAAHVVDVTSLDRVYHAWRGAIREGVRSARPPAQPGVLRTAFPAGVPVVTVHDASSHAMAWLGSALGVACVPMGVDGFGQSGSVQELYRVHDLAPGAIVNAALAALSLSG